MKGQEEQTIRISPAEGFLGKLSLPGDKSLSHRALILASLGEGRCEIRNIAPGEDIQATIRCLRQLGVRIETEGNRAIVHAGGELTSPKEPLDCGNSGTTMRLLAGLLAGAGLEGVLDGDESLRRRPMGRVLGPLREMGARCEGVPSGGGEETAPLRFSRLCGGTLRGRDHRLPVASAQVKSALLLAGLFAEGGTHVHEPLPSRDHTERMLAAFSPQEGKLPLRLPPSLTIPGDPSSAAFLVAAAILLPGGDLTLEAMASNATRIGWIAALRRMGAKLDLAGETLVAGEPVATLHARQAPRLVGIDIAKEEIPSLVDEIPILAVLATQAEGTTRIRGARELRLKESDRLASMARGLAAMGAAIEEEEDGLKIHGPTPLRGAEVEAHSDHRVAMSLAIAGMVAKGETSIRGGGWASVSFPGFYSLLLELSRPAP